MREPFSRTVSRLAPCADRAISSTRDRSQQKACIHTPMTGTEGPAPCSPCTRAERELAHRERIVPAVRCVCGPKTAPTFETERWRRTCGARSGEARSVDGYRKPSRRKESTIEANIEALTVRGVVREVARRRVRRSWQGSVGQRARRVRREDLPRGPTSPRHDGPTSWPRLPSEASD